MSSEGIATILAGVIWPFIFQLLGKFGLADKMANWAAVLLSFVLAGGVIIATGGAVTPDKVLADGTLIATLANVVYRQIIKV